jgi:hypothetical protein
VTAEERRLSRARRGFGRFYDVVYYWTGEEWRDAEADTDKLGAAIDELERRGGGDYRDGHFCGLRCGYAFAVRISDLGARLRPGKG